MPPEVAELYLEVLKDVEDSSGKERVQTAKALRLELVELEEKLSKADVSYFEEDLEAESYTRVKKHYTVRRDKARAKLVMIEERDRDLVKHAEFGLSLISDLPGYWTRAPLDVKRDLVGLMFGGKLVFEKSVLRTPELHPIFALFDTKMGQNRQDRSPERVTGPDWYRVRDLKKILD